MKRDRISPDYVFESSWEVCNKVGGIYTVLSTRARTMQDKYQDRVIFIGPDCRQDLSPYFQEDPSLFPTWQTDAIQNSIRIKVGRWLIPGNPIAVLVDFSAYYEQKNQLYTDLWNWFGVDSLHAYGDYDEASMFSIAAAKVVESFYHHFQLQDKKVIYHANEWMTAMGMLYIKHHLPQIATIFTTHATSIGRSIAGNNKPLYQYLDVYDGHIMARELNMESKHSVEFAAARYTDCFSTVSDITATECKQLLAKPVDIVLPNGFEDDFVPHGVAFTKAKKQAKKTILRLANALTGVDFQEETLIVSTSGRYEVRNKGIDVFVSALNRLRAEVPTDKKIIALIEVPAWVYAPRQDLAERIQSTQAIFSTPLDQPYITHWLHNMSEDAVLQMFRHYQIKNQSNDNVFFIFIPQYMDGHDGIVNLHYYNLILANDLCVYPSYYEPWGYTPLEAIAFKIPCITTNLSGFGRWINQVLGKEGDIQDGVAVLQRDDYNFENLAQSIAATILMFANSDDKQQKQMKTKAARLAQKALWNHFFEYYEEAYHIALSKVLSHNTTQH